MVHNSEAVLVNTTGLREVGTNEDIVELTAGETRGYVDILLKVEPCLMQIQKREQIKSLSTFNCKPRPDSGTFHYKPRPRSGISQVQNLALTVLYVPCSQHHGAAGGGH